MSAQNESILDGARGGIAETHTDQADRVADQFGTSKTDRNRESD